MQFGPKVLQRETSRVWFPSLPLSSISLSSPTWLVSCMFVMSSTQKGAFSIYINAGVRSFPCRRALKRESSRPHAIVQRGARGVQKALFSLASALRGAFFPSFLFAGVRARSFIANYEGMLLHRCRRRYFAGVRARSFQHC